MNLQTLAASLLCAVVSTAALAAETPPPPLKVAFVISENFNVMDFAGPWEVFQDVVLPAATPGGDSRSAFELYTVSASLDTVTTTGGARVVPSYTFATAPRPDIVVIGAQKDNSPALLEWLRTQYAAHATVTSICTGARKLALSGLLDGRSATTHHEYLADFRDKYPRVHWVDSRRYVRAGERLYTAGGLTSGIDLALHLVAERFDTGVAQATADYMEYRSKDWTERE